MEFFAKYYKDKPIEPISDNDFRKILKLKDGDIFRGEKWRERNVKFLRKYFALLNCTINHLPEDHEFDRYRNVDTLRCEIMLQTGRYNIHRTLGNKETYLPHSISFKSMDEEEFEKLYSEALDIILKRFLPFISQEDFEKDILNFI